MALKRCRRGGSHPVAGYRVLVLVLPLFPGRLEGGWVGLWAHRGRTEQLSQAGLQTTAAVAAGLTGSTIASSSELRMPSSSHSAVAPTQKAAEPVSPKGFCVMAHFGQCFPILPNRFLLKVYRSFYIQTMTWGPFEDGGEEQPLCPTLRSTPHLSLTVSHLDCHWGRKAGKDNRCWNL